MNTTELAKLRQASEDLREKTSELERNAGELALVHKQQRQVRDEVDSAVQIMVRTGAEGLSSAVTLPKLTTWIDRRTEALKRWKNSAARTLKSRARVRMRTDIVGGLPKP